MKQTLSIKSMNDQIKHSSFLLLIAFFLCSSYVKSQATFVLSSTACVGYNTAIAANIGTNTALAYTWAVAPTGPVIVNPAVAITSISFPTAGTYTVVLGVLFTVGYGYTTNVITIVPGPTITVSQNSVSTCIENNFPKFSKPVKLTASGATTYNWFPYDPNNMTYSLGPQTDVRPASSTCYTVTGSGSTCAGSASICVNVIPQYTIAVSPTSGVRCIPDSLKLSISAIGSLSGPFSYSWTENSPPGTISSYVTPNVKVYPLSSTSYTAEVKDATQCVSLPVTVAVAVANCVGISSAGQELQGISVYPNPANDLLNITLKESSASWLRVQFCSTLGQVIRTVESSTDRIELDLSTLPCGLYLLKVESETGSKTLKVIKE